MPPPFFVFSFGYNKYFCSFRGWSSHKGIHPTLDLHLKSYDYKEFYGVSLHKGKQWFLAGQWEKDGQVKDGACTFSNPHLCKF